jgi:hypothetical protein
LPRPLECGERLRRPAIPQSDPDDAHFCRRPLGVLNEILVLANDDEILSLGVAADFGVVGVSQTLIQNVTALEAAIFQKLRENNGKLVVDQKLRDAGRTM